jgi:hypothetical protein
VVFGRGGEDLGEQGIRREIYSRWIHKELRCRNYMRRDGWLKT